MARKRSEPAINERSYRLADGTESRTYSVRYFDRSGVRRRLACASREEADFERARIVLEQTRAVRYSTGRPVLARDVRFALERVFRVDSPVAGLYRGIAGAEGCSPQRCSLARGVVTDDRAGSVTIRLRTPDPDFLQKLAQQYAAVVPADSPLREATEAPLPATGPYMIESYRPGEELRLVRNPHCEEWSPAAQPDGYPDEIVYRLGVPLDDALDQILRGDADWVLNRGPLPAARRRELLTRHANQVHVNLQPGTFYYALNTRVPPFDDVRVRRAVNYALNRRRLARIYDAPSTCQVPPPSMPGYSPYCPYTRGAGRRGAYIGPDLDRARRLIAASHTRGMRVTVLNDLPSRDLDFVVSLLRKLGYRASGRVVPGVRYGVTTSDSRNRVQISNAGWIADYPSASNFFDLKLSCRAYLPANPYNNNAANFCDRRIEVAAEQARRLGTTDPPEAAKRWEQVYRDIVDQAPWLPTVTPRNIDFVSKRVGNYQFHPLWGMLVSQLWVR